MKIGIITFHRADNFGAVLQAFALQEKLNELGHLAEIIDYRCEAIENNYLPKPIPKIRKNMISWFKEVYVWKRESERYEQRINSFAEFRKLLKMSESVYNENDKISICEKYDLIITGSDQIWNSIITKGFDFWYFFKKPDNSHVPVCSYASSIGSVDKFSSEFDKVKNVLDQYREISVRENDAQLFLMKALSRDVSIVADPTLLFKPDYYEKMVSDDRIIKEPYIFYYDAAVNEISKKVALKIAKAKKLRLVHYNPLILPTRKNFYAYGSGPSDFLNYIKNAEYVVTSSFHATVFSILFQRKFLTVAHPNTGARVITLLDKVHLQARLCPSDDQCVISDIDKPIDYDFVFKYLSDMESESVNYLKMCTTFKQ